MDSGLRVAYVEVNSNAFANVGCYVLNGGEQFFNIACIFAANINYDSSADRAVVFFNPQVDRLLNHSAAVTQVQALGIKVLLTILGNHQKAGWSCFEEEEAAENFAQQCASIVEKYGLDGIDIDDEYSNCTSNVTSLIMVTHAMRRLMPSKIISKALFADGAYFQSTWNGVKLADVLSYGWEMSYDNGDAKDRLQPYLEAGMGRQQLALGVSTHDISVMPEIAQFVKTNGIGGMMVYDVRKDSQPYLSAVSQILDGGPTSARRGCLA